MKRIYLDWAATAVPDPEVYAECARAASEFYGNPSSKHDTGRCARAFLEECRAEWARLLGADSRHIAFTSGGTESNNAVFLPYLFATGRRRRGRIILSNLEHPSIKEFVTPLKESGFDVRLCPSEGGFLSLESLRGLLDPDTVMVSVIAVSNETGAIQPLAEAVRVVREAERRFGRPVLFHTDAVQALGKIPFRIDDLDAASFSLHKIGGPRGAGILYLRKDPPGHLFGGGQENGRRPGTENLPGIAGGLAAGRKLEAVEERYAQGRRLESAFLKALSSGVRILPASRLESPEGFAPWIIAAAVPPVPGEAMQRILNAEGVDVSTGSACSSRNSETKRLEVLTASGVSSIDAASAVRISFGPSTAEEDLLKAAEVLNKEAAGLR